MTGHEGFEGWQVFFPAVVSGTDQSEGNGPGVRHMSDLKRGRGLNRSKNAQGILALERDLYRWAGFALALERRGVLWTTSLSNRSDMPPIKFEDTRGKQMKTPETDPTTWNFADKVFDGQSTQIIQPAHPLSGAQAFTIEAVFLPGSGGGEEQRFVHLQGDDGTRALLELRSTEAGWYGDVFAHFGDRERFLNDPGKLHPHDRWHSLALIYTGSELRQAVNGSIELTGPLGPGVLGEGVVSVGMRLNRISPFKGRIAEVRLTPEALEADDLLRPPS
jgi:hypothetical protein